MSDETLEAFYATKENGKYVVKRETPENGGIEKSTVAELDADAAEEVFREYGRSEKIGGITVVAGFETFHETVSLGDNFAMKIGPIQIALELEYGENND